MSFLRFCNKTLKRRQRRQFVANKALAQIATIGFGELQSIIWCSWSINGVRWLNAQIAANTRPKPVGGCCLTRQLALNHIAEEAAKNTHKTDNYVIARDASQRLASDRARARSAWPLKSIQDVRGIWLLQVRFRTVRHWSTTSLRRARVSELEGMPPSAHGTNAG